MPRAVTTLTQLGP